LPKHTPQHRFSIVACVRWEEADIAEWVQYHQLIGFDHIYLYSNDTDPLPTHKALLPWLRGPRPFVTFNHFPKRTTRPQQHFIYYHFLETYRQETEWFSFLDADEFFVLRGVDDIGRFMQPFEAHSDAVYFNWMIYGHGGKEQRDGNSILLSHTSRAQALDPHTKTMTRSAAIDVPALQKQYEHGKPGFWHFWDPYEVGVKRLVNVLHEDMSGYAEAFPRRAYEVTTRPGVAERVAARAYVAHFQFKSEADFQRRVDRGGSLTVPLWRRALADGTSKDFLRRGGDVQDSYLAQLWLDAAGTAYDIALPDALTAEGWHNVALRKPTRQSSLRRAVEGDAADSHPSGHANNGLRTGGFGFATTQEADPWWTMDLLGEFILREIRIYAAAEAPGWAIGTSALMVETSLDGTAWTSLADRLPITACPVTAGPMVRIPIDRLVTARFLRLSLKGEGALQCDEVEVYARPA
jgi:hypothetical protein